MGGDGPDLKLGAWFSRVGDAVSFRACANLNIYPITTKCIAWIFIPRNIAPILGDNWGTMKLHRIIPSDPRSYFYAVTIPISSSA